MSKLIDGKELARSIKESLKEEVKILKEAGIIPKLAVVLVGDDSASKIYVRNKNKACKDTDIEYEEYLLKEETTMEELTELINKLNNDNTISGILVQCPLPEHLDANKIFELIDPKKDVDGFNPVNIGKLSLNEDCFVSCTPYGIIKMLEAYNISIQGANAVVIGRSNIVGKPLAKCLLNKNATVTVCHSKTQNLKEVTNKADIIISAIGKAKFVTADMVKEGAVVIDVGINRNSEGKVVGDVDFDEVSKKASHITPVPGGVGPMTIAMLMKNVVKASKGL